MGNPELPAALPLLLDLFCGAGGASAGYARAGFRVVGVDIRPQPRYPYTFVRADALSPPFDLSQFDAIHASPPCQGYARLNLDKREHPKLVDEVRAMLKASGRPYVIENVHGAPLHWPMRLCGTAFGLMTTIDGTEYELRRHRYFEIAPEPGLTPPCRHKRPVVGIYGHGEATPKAYKRGFQTSDLGHRRALMQMPWADREELAEAIPPAFTEYVGHLLRQTLGGSPCSTTSASVSSL